MITFEEEEILGPNERRVLGMEQEQRRVATAEDVFLSLPLKKK